MFHYLKAAAAAALFVLALTAITLTDVSSAFAAEEQQQNILDAGEIRIDPAVLAELKANEAAVDAAVAAEDNTAQPNDENIVFVSNPVIMPLPERSAPKAPDFSEATSLAQLVDMQDSSADLDAEQRCQLPLGCDPTDVVAVSGQLHAIGMPAELFVKRIDDGVSSSYGFP